jgi:hypothetical protein
MFLKRFYYPMGLTLLLAGFSLPAFAVDTSLLKISPPVQRTESDARFISYAFAPGTAFHVLIQTPISTEINQPDDPVEAITNQTLYLYEELIIPKNTRFIGRISQLEPPFEGKDAVLSVVFNQIILQNGEKIPIVAHVRTDRPDHTWGGQLTQGTKPLLSTQRVTGIGAYNKIVWDGPRAMGKHITIPPGEHWTLILDQPLSILKAREESF